MSAIHIFFEAYPELERGIDVGRYVVNERTNTAQAFGTLEQVTLERGEYIFVYDNHYPERLPKHLPTPDYCLDINPEGQYVFDKVLIWRDNFDKSID